MSQRKKTIFLQSIWNFQIWWNADYLLQNNRKKDCASVARTPTSLWRLCDFEWRGLSVGFWWFLQKQATFRVEHSFFFDFYFCLHSLNILWNHFRCFHIFPQRNYPSHSQGCVLQTLTVRNFQHLIFLLFFLRSAFLYIINFEKFIWSNFY